MKHDDPLPIANIRIDGGTQPRAMLDFEAIEDYAEAMGAGVKFPPVVVFYDGENYWLADGFHRVKAAYAAGFDTIVCEICQGTLEEAQWYSFSANRNNGLRRTTQDKQRAIKAALLHACGQTLSDRQIAKHVGVDQKTVTNWRQQLEASEEIPKIASRTVSRRGKEYQQDTSNLRKRKGRRRRNRAAGDAVSRAPIQPQIGRGVDALISAVNVITHCEASPEELAKHLAARPDRDQLISYIEKANEFLELCAANARRVGSHQQPADDNSVPRGQAGNDAHHARTGPTVARAECPQSADE